MNGLKPTHSNKQFKPNKMTPEALEKLHEDIINKNTYIASLKRDIRNLDELIHGNKTYSHDVNFQEKLKHLSQRMKNNLKEMEKACDGMNDFIESQLK